MFSLCTLLIRLKTGTMKTSTNRTLTSGEHPRYKLAWWNDARRPTNLWARPVVGKHQSALPTRPESNPAPEIDFYPGGTSSINHLFSFFWFFMIPAHWEWVHVSRRDALPLPSFFLWVFFFYFPCEGLHAARLMLGSLQISEEHCPLGSPHFSAT